MSIPRTAPAPDWFSREISAPSGQIDSAGAEIVAAAASTSYAEPCTVKRTRLLPTRAMESTDDALQILV